MNYLITIFMALLCSYSSLSPSVFEAKEPKELNSSFFTGQSNCLKKWDSYYSIWKKEVGNIHTHLSVLKLNIQKDERTKISKAIKYVWSKEGGEEYNSCIHNESEIYCRYTLLNDYFPEDKECGASAFLASAMSEDMLRNKKIFYSTHDSIQFTNKESYLESSNIFLNEVLSSPHK